MEFQTLQGDLQEYTRLNRELEKSKDEGIACVSSDRARWITQRMYVLRKRMSHPTPRQSLFGSRRGRLRTGQQRILNRYQPLIHTLRQIGNLLD